MIFSILIGLWLVLGLIAYIRFIVYCKEYRDIIKTDEWVKICSIDSFRWYCEFFSVCCNG